MPPSPPPSNFGGGGGDDAIGSLPSSSSSSASYSYSHSSALKQPYISSHPTLKPVANIYCLSGTYGGYGGPSDMYSHLDPNTYNANIIRAHTSQKLHDCVDELVETIIKFNSASNLPIILLGWSQGGYTVINACKKLLVNTPYFKKIKTLIVISSRPENTEFMGSEIINQVHKFIICGDQDTERRMTGASNMHKIASEPKQYIVIQNGTHNYESKESLLICIKLYIVY